LKKREGEEKGRKKVLRKPPNPSRKEKEGKRKGEGGKNG